VLDIIASGSTVWDSLYDLTSYQTLTNVVARTIAAHRDTTGAAQDLVVGATSNVKVEAVSSVSTHVKDTGLVKFFATTTTTSSGGVVTRQDEEFLRVARSGSTSNNTTSATTQITSGSNMSLTLLSQDAQRTARLSGVTMSNNGVYQYITADKPFKFDAVGTSMSNLVASDHVFGSDFNLVKTYQGASNAGDLAKAGYSFRINADNHLELIRYCNFLESGGSREVYVKVATFGKANIARDSVGDVADYDAYDTYGAISNFDPQAPVSVPNSAWVAGVQGAVASKTDGAGNTYVVGVDSYATTTTPSSWTAPATLYNAGGTASSVTVYNPGADVKMFIVKYDPAGAVAWARGVAGAVQLRTAHICFDSRNYLTVVCNGTTAGSFDVTNAANSSRVTHAYVATPAGQVADMAFTFDRDGEFNNVVAVVGVESPALNDGSIDQSAVGIYDDRDQLHISGVYSRSKTLVVQNCDGQTSFVSLPSRTPVSQAHDKVAYIAKFNATKRVLWLASPGFRRGKRSSIGVDGQGNVYAAGRAYKDHEPVLNGDGSLSSSVTSSMGSFLESTDVLASCVTLIKYSPQGVAQWSAGTDMAYVDEYDVNVAVNTYDEVFLTGVFDSSPTRTFKVYDSSGGIAAGLTWPAATYRPAGQYKATYCVKYSTLGQAQWSFMVESKLSGGTVLLAPCPVFDAGGNPIIAQGFKDDVLVFYNANGSAFRRLHPQGTDGGAYIAKYSAQTGACMWADYAVAGLTDVLELTARGGAEDTSSSYHLLMKKDDSSTAATSVTFADWSTALTPPIKTLLLKIANQNYSQAPQQPTPSNFPGGLAWSRFDGANFGAAANRDIDWFKGKTPAASGTVASIASTYLLDPGQFAAYGVADAATTNTSFALILRGYFRPGITGAWRFTLSASDFAMMWIGDAAASPGTTNKQTNAFITTDSASSYTAELKTSAALPLVANQYYPVLIYYGNVNGNASVNASGGSSAKTLVLNFSGPGAPNSIEGAGFFFYDTNWSAPFVPTGIPVGPVVNLQAKTLSALANGGRVQTWGEFAQSTLGNRPVYFASTYGGGYNGGAFVSFTGADRQSLYSSSPLNFNNVTANGGLTYALLVRVRGGSAGTLVYSDQFSSPRVVQASGTNMLTIGVSPSNISYSPNAWQVFVYKVDNVNQSLVVKRNDVTIVDVVTSSSGAVTMTGPVSFALGSTGTSAAATAEASGWANADVGAYMVYDRPLTDSEMTQLYSYISNGYATDD
jgi:hypothetical protein